MNPPKFPVSRKDNLVVQEMNGEVLIYDLTTNKAFCLNETSAIVWQLCDGKNSLTEISAELSQKLNSPASEDLVWFALDQLKKEKLIVNADELPNNFVGMNRREIIRKVGLGTMVALPIIASIVSPTVVEAASCISPLNRVLNAPCTQSCQCFNNFVAGPNNMCCRLNTVGIFPANVCSIGLIGGCRPAFG